MERDRELPLMPAQITLVAYDPSWPGAFRAHAARIKRAIGSCAARIDHVGSTAVPGLAAKPVIDIVLEVPDSALEADYLPALTTGGYQLRIREPEWFEHRLVTDSERSVNVHIFSAGCPETARMIRFRDRLRADAGARDLYQDTKQRLAKYSWESVQQYADAKTDVVNAILTGESG